MTLQECYIKMGGDYQDVMGRLGTEARIEKFLAKFLSDKSYQLLCDTMKNGNMEEAFRAVHTLKGVCLNLGLSRLAESSSALTEKLRGGVPDADAEIFFKKVQEDYYIVSQSIQELING